MAKYAITPRGEGKPVGWRLIEDNAPLSDTEPFSVTFDPRGYVLDVGGTSLRAVSNAEVIAEEKEKKRVALREARERALGAGVSYQGNVYDSDREAVTNVFQALQGLQAVASLPPEVQALLPGPVPETITWKLADNSYTDLTVQDLIFLMAILALHKQTQFAIEKSLLDALDAATTSEAIQAINWPS